jgi:hypothetical protein
MLLCAKTANGQAYYYCYEPPQPVSYVIPAEPIYYCTEPWNQPNDCQCSNTATYNICKPTWETDINGNRIAKPVWEQKSLEYTYAIAKPIEVPFKGTPLTLGDTAINLPEETILIAARFAVANAKGLRLGRACIDNGIIDIEFVRDSDETTGHVTLQNVASSTLTLTAWLRPKNAGQNQEQTKDGAKQAFRSIRKQLAAKLKVPEPQED